MKIYVGHSKGFNYQKDLYKPIRNSHLNTEHEIVFPHEKSDKPFNSKDFLKTCDVMIAEVSYSATGLGIELGWANVYKIPIICVYKKGASISGSLKVITDNFIEYSSTKNLINNLIKSLESLKK